MTAGIVGLGLIGGSFAKAYHKKGERVLAFNRSREVVDFAMINGDVDAVLTKDNVSECDIIIICIYQPIFIKLTAYNFYWHIIICIITDIKYIVN